MSTLFGSMPAAVMLAFICPTAPLLPSKAPSPLPVSITHELRAGVDDHRVERNGDLALRHIGGFGRRKRVFLLLVDHERVRHREGARAVGELRHLEVADLVAIEAGVLLAGARRGGAQLGGAAA